MYRFHGGKLALFLTACLLNSVAVAKPDWSGGPGGKGSGSGGGGDAGGGASPVLAFSADSTEHALGEKVQLSWASEGTRFCQASGDWSGKFDTSGAYWTPPIDGPKAFTLKCVSQGGGVESTVYVTVTASDSGSAGGSTPTDPAPTPTLSLSAADPEVPAGDSTTLTWHATDADTCVAGDAWAGSFGPDGSQLVGPLDATSTFSLSCSGAGGSVEASAVVTVTEPAPAPAPAPTPTLSFSTSDPEVLAGDSTTLTWHATDADTCVAGDAWAGSFGPDGSQLVGPLDATSTFSLSCSGAGGSVDASVMVSVTEPAPAPTPAPTVALSASATEIAGGGSTTLTWSSTDADQCTAGGGWSGTFGPSGTQSVGGITSSTSFSLTCTGSGGSASDSTSVTVVPAPSVSLSSADSSVPSGGTTSLTWSSTDADTCQASGGWSGARSPAGSEAVGPIDGSTTFTLSCTGIGGSAMQMVSVSAIGEIQISWVAPTENVDGTPLTDLASFRIYYGPDSRAYSNSVDVMDASATSYALNAASGDYYVTMTALDAEGNESAYANEILRSVP
jgi:hypothetical protein